MDSHLNFNSVYCLGPHLLCPKLSLGERFSASLLTRLRIFSTYAMIYARVQIAPQVFVPSNSSGQSLGKSSDGEQHGGCLSAPCRIFTYLYDILKDLICKKARVSTLIDIGTYNGTSQIGSSQLTPAQQYRRYTLPSLPFCSFISLTVCSTQRRIQPANSPHDNGGN